MKIKKLLIALTLALVLTLTVAAPAFADAPDKVDKIRDSGPSWGFGTLHGLLIAALNHCCNPGHSGSANAAAVFYQNWNLSCYSRW